MKRFNYCYAVDGMKSFIPMYIMGQANSVEDAHKQAVELVKIKWPGKAFTIYAEKDIRYDPLGKTD